MEETNLSPGATLRNVAQCNSRRETFENLDSIPLAFLGCLTYLTYLLDLLT